MRRAQAALGHGAEWAFICRERHSRIAFCGWLAVLPKRNLHTVRHLPPCDARCAVTACSKVVEPLRSWLGVCGIIGDGTAELIGSYVPKTNEHPEVPSDRHCRAFAGRHRGPVPAHSAHVFHESGAVLVRRVGEGCCRPVWPRSIGVGVFSNGNSDSLQGGGTRVAFRQFPCAAKTGHKDGHDQGRNCDEGRDVDESQCLACHVAIAAPRPRLRDQVIDCSPW